MVQMIFLFDWVISRFKMLIFRGVEIETMDLGVRIWRMKQHMAQLHYQILRDSLLKKSGR